MHTQNLPPEHTSPELTDERPDNVQTDTSFDPFLPWRSFSGLTEVKELFKKQSVLTVHRREVGAPSNAIFYSHTRIC